MKHRSNSLSVLPAPSTRNPERKYPPRTEYQVPEQFIPDLQEHEADIVCNEELLVMVPLAFSYTVWGMGLKECYRLSTQPEGPVILIGHSMGGFLAADAATHPSNRDEHGKPKRIVGVIAFDVPFLGMHPHVVISGIASLFAKDEAKGGKTEREMNQHPEIHVVDSHATSDEWEDFKAKIKGRSCAKVLDT